MIPKLDAHETKFIASRAVPEWRCNGQVCSDDLARLGFVA